MLKIIFPKYRKERILILEDYMKIQNYLDNIDIIEKDLSTSFLLLEIRRQNKNGYIRELGSLLSFANMDGKISGELKSISGILKRTFKTERLSKVYYTYKKLHKLKSLFPLKKKISYYLETNSE